MTNPVPAGAPFLQRSCALCGVVDGGPRERIVTPSGQDAFYHHDNDGCAVPNADPRPDLDEPPSVSRQRHALTHDPNCITPPDSEYLTTHVVDASDPNAEIVTLSERPADITEA